MFPLFFYKFMIVQHHCLFDFFFVLKEVEPNSPADIAGLRSHSDFIIGADSILHEVSMFVFCCVLYTYKQLLMG